MKLYWFYKDKGETVLWKLISSDGMTKIEVQQPFKGFFGCLEVMNALAGEIRKRQALNSPPGPELMKEWEEIAKKAWNGDPDLPQAQ